MTPPEPVPIRISEAARALGLHPNTVRNMVADGRLRDVRAAGSQHMRVDRNEVDELTRQTVPDIDATLARYRLRVPDHVLRIEIEIDRS